METNDYIFQFNNIAKQFRNRNRLIFQGEQGQIGIQREQFTFITGDSGVGKSSLMNLLGLLDWADNNNRKNSEITFLPAPEQKAINYFNLYHKDAWFFQDQCASIRRQYFGFLPQQGHLLHTFSIEQNLSLVAHLRNSSPNHNVDQNIDEILSKVGFDTKNLKERLKFSPAQLSGGEAQRLALARAILYRPKVIFVDEPTTFMDEALVKRTLEVLADTILLGDCTVILITHEYDKLAKILHEYAHQSNRQIPINQLTLSRVETEAETLDAYINLIHKESKLEFGQ